MGDLPRYVLEAIALSALLLGIVLLLPRDDWSRIVAILSVYAMAGYRLLPAAQAVFRSASTIKADIQALDDIRDDIETGCAVQQDNPSEHQLAFPLDQPVEFRDVRFTYPEST